MTPTASSTRSFLRVEAWLVLVLGVAAAAACPPTRAAEDEARAAQASRLADSKSSYLLLHADNPVEWYPWGEEAFAKARAEDKPIFLSVGYSTCYWCHVAERTLYSDPFIAGLMNRWFVNVKVDREQHPDVDALYMLARYIIDGSGGWPNNVFLTPELRPFFAGSYFAPEDGPLGQPGFPRVLRALHKTWSERRDEVMEVAAIVHARMQSLQDPSASGEAGAIEPAAWLAESVETFMGRFDPRYGGQRSKDELSKFPQSPLLLLLLASEREDDGGAVLRAVTKTLDEMAYGGIYDHLGGGFHRYSTEPTWSVPHFEKMLYDNAQLLEVYARAYRRTGAPLYRYVAEDVASYLVTRMTSPGGTFFTAQDAQVDGVEGASYRWHEEQVEAVIGERSAERFFAVYELVRVPEIAGGTGYDADAGGVLRVRLPMEKTLRRAGFDDPVDMLVALRPLRDRLLAARDARPQPLRDEKINVDLNALAISGLAASGAALGESEHLDAARRAAERVWRLAYDAQTGRLMHQIYRGEATVDGYLSDYALLGRAFLALEETTGDGLWRERARALADSMLERFMTPEGGLPMTADGRHLLVPVHSMGDDVQPSGTSAAIELLLGLGEAPDGAAYRAAAERVLAFYGARIAMAPAYWPSAVLALNSARAAPRTSASAAGTRGATQRLPQSGDRVKVSARATDGAGEDVVVVTLSVDAGYHINANPASLDYLIPTSVAFEGLTPSRIRYPEPVPFAPSFADLAIQVYEGEQRIVSTFPDGSLRHGTPVAAAVTVQACNEEICLPPSTIPVTVTPAADSP